MVTRAQEVASIAHAMGWTPSRLSWFLGVQPNSVRRWIAKAKVDSGGEECGAISEPEPKTVAHVRALALLQRAAPGAMGAIRGDRDKFARTLDSIPTLRLTWEAVPEDSPVYDGADFGDG